MAKNQRDKPKKLLAERKSFMSRWITYSPELKLIFITLLVFGAVVAIFPFLPFNFFAFSPDHVATCRTTTTAAVTGSSATVTTTVSQPPPLLPSPEQPRDEVLRDGTIRRSFYPVGTAAYNFVLMSAYRGGPHTFAVMGLSSKPLHTYGRPTYTCEYQSRDSNASTMVVPGEKLSFQDFGYARVYLVIVVNCTFPSGTDPSTGGRLILHASTNGGYDRAVNSTDTIVALDEPPHSWGPSQFSSSPPKYDYLYCGSSLFGNLSPQRVREWIAYHVKFFGARSHFVIHDAGGVHPKVLEVLKPWIELGYVTVEDIREQERFDAFYHNQMLVLNDCLHRHRFSTKWMFFFDLDEFLYLPGKSTIESVINEVKDYTLFVIEQVSMSNRVCLSQDAGNISKLWGFEKLVYKNAKKMRRDFKYAIQPRNVFATGVHMSENLVGKTTRLSDKLIKYYHFHGTVAERREPCRQFVNNDTSIKVDNIPYALDTTLRSLGSSIKKFELDTIGSRLQSTKL